jgi:hypothetical protein
MQVDRADLGKALIRFKVNLRFLHPDWLRGRIPFLAAVLASLVVILFGLGVVDEYFASSTEQSVSVGLPGAGVGVALGVKATPMIAVYQPITLDWLLFQKVTRTQVCNPLILISGRNATGTITVDLHGVCFQGGAVLIQPPAIQAYSKGSVLFTVPGHQSVYVDVDYSSTSSGALNYSDSSQSVSQPRGSLFVQASTDLTQWRNTVFAAKVAVAVVIPAAVVTVIRNLADLWDRGRRQTGKNN